MQLPKIFHPVKFEQPLEITLLCRLNLDLRNNSGASALWLALQQLDSASIDSDESEHTFAARLIKRGSNIDAIDTRTGNSLLHRAAMESNEAAAMFLVHHSAMCNHRNGKGETPIHIAAQNGLHRLVEVLLQNGADPNLQTDLKPKLNPIIPSPLILSRTASPIPGGHERTGSTTNTVSQDSGVMGGSDVMGVEILSPSTLGALNALSFTSQVLDNVFCSGTQHLEMTLNIRDVTPLIK